ncbi:vacuolar protein sorting-associated protein 45 [Diaphorina citri]|uniref:Vacuolar protein sorting-associated protein 45 n=1 Tax=Diaphorina citri TaxID=121845 RepID=A0A3Q0IWI9_DIACI|nr:vacuolar protein sorting-associated protein 45 [Diaphorina citri]
MNVVRAIKQYVIKMTEQSGPGMKILLLDKQTTSIVSMVFTQSEILQREVYMFEKIEISTQCDYENMKHLKCIALLRPTKENIALLCKELKNPKFGSYYIYFTNIIPKADIKTLAEYDEQESVREIEELYADYLPILPHFFSLNIPLCSNGHFWDPVHLVRSSQGLIALLLSLNKNPVIRYQASSEMTKRLAEKVKETIIKEEKLFDMRQGDAVPVLLIIDRTCDPITPLLSQWTYQAMLHELLTINNNRVDLSHVSGISPDLKQVVVSYEHDDFYSSNLFMNYGEIGQTIKLLMDDFNKRAKSQQKVESIQDMKAFVENYPQFKMKKLLTSGKIRDVEAVRLVMLYAIRYEHHSNNDLSGLMDILRRIGVSESLVQMPLQVLDYSNEHSKYTHHNDSFSATQDVMVKKTQRVSVLALIFLFCLNVLHSHTFFAGLMDILRRIGVSESLVQMPLQVLDYSNEHSKYTHHNDSFSATQDVMVKKTQRFLKDLKGVENVYTQHEPVLKDILDDLVKGKLKDTHFPYLDPYQGRSEGSRWYQDIIVFMVGGTTYEECLCVHQMNTSSGNNARAILLGATTVHNSTSFMQQVRSHKI